MALHDYSDLSGESFQNYVLDQLGLAFTIIFLNECILKIIALGFMFHKNAYLRDAWNWLDFIAVIVGAIEFLPSLPNLKVLRTLRIIRPLRSFKALPSMRRLITSLLNSLKGLANVVVFLLFTFAVFGIFGIQLFQTEFYWVCRKTQYPDNITNYWPIDLEYNKLCNNDSDCPLGEFCGNPITLHLPLSQDSDIQKYTLINYGITNFDNILYSTLTIFQVITLEGWTQLMYCLSDVGYSIVSPIYFCLLVLIGSFFLLNLNLAVIMNEFTKVDNILKEEQMKALEYTMMTIKSSPEKADNDNGSKYSQMSQNSQQRLLEGGRDQKSRSSIKLLQISSSNQPSLLMKKNTNEQISNRQTSVRNLMNINQDNEHQFQTSRDQSLQFNENSQPNLTPDIDRIKTSSYYKNHQDAGSNDKINNLSCINEPPIQQQNFIGIESKEDLELDLLQLPGKHHQKDSEQRVSRLNLSDIVQAKTQKGRQTQKFPVRLSSTNKPKRIETIHRLESRSQEIPNLALIKVQNEKQDNIESSSLDTNNDNQNEGQVEELENSKLMGTKPDDLQNTKEDEIITRSRKNKIFRFFYLFCTHLAFTGVIIFMIIANTIILAFDRYPITKSEQSTLEQINDILSICFISEMVIKLIGLGPKGYARDRFNLFDCLIVVISIAELIVQEAQVDLSISSSGAISAFRAIRLLRIFKLARSWKSFQLMLVQIGKTLKDISNFIIVLFLFIFIYAMMGMELYAYKIRFDPDGNPINLDNLTPDEIKSAGSSPRENFDDLLMGITTIFIVLIGDGWNNIMYNYIRAQGLQQLIFFVVLYILGKMILLNLFLAMLLKNFEDFSPKTQSGPEDKLFEKIKKYFSDLYKRLRINKVISEQVKTELVTKKNESPNSNHSHNGDENHQTEKGDQSNPPQLNQEGPAVQENEGRFQKFAQMKTFKSQDERKELTEFQSQESRRGLLINSKSLKLTGVESPLAFAVKEKIVQSYQEKIKQLSAKRKRKSIFATEIGHSSKLFKLKSMRNNKWFNPFHLNGKSLLLFDVNNCLRNFCANIVHHKLFDPFILIIITITTITLALDNPLNDPNGEFSQTLSKLDISFTTLFGFEFLLKTITFGFLLNGTTSYLRNAWNCLDFIIVAFSFASIYQRDNIDFSFIKVIRMLRVLRPLRVISRNQGLKLAVQSLLNSIVGIFHVFVVSSLFFLLFGIFGINYFKGQMRYCYTDHLDSSIFDISNIPTKFDCYAIGGEWINSDANFDDIFLAMKTLFEMSSEEGWEDVMWSGVDSAGIDHSPVLNNKPIWVLFFILFQLFGSMFIMNLFVTVVINTFNEENERLGKNHLLSDVQREWVMIQIQCMKLKPLKKVQVETHNCIRKYCVRISNSLVFEIFILGCIILNMVCLSIEWYDQPVSVNEVLDNINYVFAVIFTTECIIKLTGFGFRSYFTVPWNVFDFIVVLSTIISIFLTIFLQADLKSSITLIRSFRIGRVLRLVSKAEFLKRIFNTFIVTIPSMGNVGGLLILLYYIFSILGMFLFSDIKLQDNLDVHANFQTFYNAFLTMIRCSTGESWNYIMNDCARKKSIIFDCSETYDYTIYAENGFITYGCGDPSTAYPFFIVFTLLVSMIFLNLFIAIILDSFENVNRKADLKVKDQDLDVFMQCWLKFDENGTGFIEVSQFDELLLMLISKKSNLLKFHDQLQADSVMRRHFMEELELPTYQKLTKFHYSDVLTQMSKAVLQIEIFEKSRLAKGIIEEDEGNQNSDNVNINKEIEVIEQLNQNERIILVEEYQKLLSRINSTKERSIDQFDGNIYNSRFVFLLPIMNARIKLWLAKRRKERQLQELEGIQSPINQNEADLFYGTESHLFSPETKSVSNQLPDDQATAIIEMEDELVVKTKIKSQKTMGIMGKKKDNFLFKAKTNNLLSTYDSDQQNKMSLSNQESSLNESPKDTDEEAIQIESTMQRRFSKQIAFKNEKLRLKMNMEMPSVISEVRQEESSFSTQKHPQKSSEDNNISNAKASSPQNSNLAFGFPNEAQDSSDYQLQVQIQSNDEHSNIIDNYRRSSSIPDKSDKKNDELFTKVENPSPKVNQLLTVSFGISDNIKEDYSDLRIFSLADDQKNDEADNSQQSEENKRSRNSHGTNSPKFSINRGRTQQFDLNMNSPQGDAFQKQQTQQIESIHKRLSQLINRSNSGSKTASPKRQLKNDVLVIEELYTDQESSYISQNDK